jgi:hypothetical protein
MCQLKSGTPRTLTLAAHSTVKRATKLEQQCHNAAAAVETSLPSTVKGVVPIASLKRVSPASANQLFGPAVPVLTITR